MKILLYNIAYGTGNPGGELRRLLTGHHYLLAPERPFRKIGKFIASQSPDVICLIETDLGSRRTRQTNQVKMLAEELGYQCFFRQKYAPASLLRRLPYLRYQGNAILAREQSVEQSVDFFPRGAKKLILFTQIGDVTLVLVHLALGRKIRQMQLRYLAEKLPRNVPLVLAGDFNTFGGAPELTEFLRTTGLRSANDTNHPTYPAWAPIRELDYLLLSPELQSVSFEVPHVRFSDHLPLLLKIETVRESE